MQLIKFNHRYDYGHDWYVQILSTNRHFPSILKNLTLLQISISWNDYPSWPYLQIKSGCGGVLSIVFWVYKFGIDISILERTWNWDYMKDIEQEDDVQHTS
ncbi:hypothetical protein [Synechococcus phage DSL-LC03]|nr:hypothetical protein [Synechococcus phage DSL-LC03]